MLAVGQTYRFTCPECGKAKEGLALYGRAVIVRCCGNRRTIKLDEPARPKSRRAKGRINDL